MAGRSPSEPGSRPSDRAQEVAAVPASIPNAAWKCGHERTPENTKRVRAGTGQACKTCFKAHNREYMRRKRAGARHDPAALLRFARRFSHVLRRLKSNGDWSDGPAPWTISNALVSARKNGLCESKLAREYPVQCRWRITPLGTATLSFAEHLAAQGTEARRAETENTGSVHDGPAGVADASMKQPITPDTMER